MPFPAGQATDILARLITQSMGEVRRRLPGGRHFFVTRARSSLNWRSSRRELAALQSLEVGHLTVGAPALVTSVLLPGIVARFMARYPGIRLTIKVGGAEEIATRVLRGEFDIGIIADWRTPEGLVTRLLPAMPIAACVAATSPLAARKSLSWRQLLEQSLILYPHGYYQRARIEDVATRLGRTLDVKLETEFGPSHARGGQARPRRRNAASRRCRRPARRARANVAARRYGADRSMPPSGCVAVPGRRGF